jgi:hypothetical protein
MTTGIQFAATLQPVASSILALVRNVAGAFGISAFATILTNATENSMAAIARYSIVNTTNPVLQMEAFALMGLSSDRRVSDRVPGGRLCYGRGFLVGFVDPEYKGVEYRTDARRIGC